MAPGVLLALTQAGVVLWVDRERIRYRAPIGALTAELREQVAACRFALLALLRSGAVLPKERAEWSDRWRGQWEERAGFLQFEGGLDRSVAEREAERLVRVEFTRAFLERGALIVAPETVAVATSRSMGGPHRAP